MQTERRTLLGAIIAAPSVAFAATAHAAPLGLCERETEALLDDAARHDPDRDFGLLCASALYAVQEAEAAFWTYERARLAAEAEAPPYPPGLCYRAEFVSLRGPDKGRVTVCDLRCDPRPDMRQGALADLAQARADETGESVAEATAQLRAEHAAWLDGCAAAERRHNVPALLAAYQNTRSVEALAAVMAHPARSPRSFLTKLRLRATEHDWPQDGDALDAFTAEAERALAHPA
jgi:hypothetical protein